MTTAQKHSMQIRRWIAAVSKADAAYEKTGDNAPIFKAEHRRDMAWDKAAGEAVGDGGNELHYVFADGSVLSLDTVSEVKHTFDDTSCPLCTEEQDGTPIGFCGFAPIRDLGMKVCLVLIRKLDQTVTVAEVAKAADVTEEQAAQAMTLLNETHLRDVGKPMFKFAGKDVEAELNVRVQQ